MRSTVDLARVTNPILRLVQSMARRMAIKLSSGTLWQVAGGRDAEGNTETHQVENFSGIGFYARPPSGGKPEAVVIWLGGHRSPTIVATRDEATRQAMAAIGEDEAVVYNSKSMVLIKANGAIEVRSANGLAVPLATKIDLDILKAAIATAPIALGAAGAAGIATACDTAAAALSAPAWPICTKTLLAE